MFIPYSTTQSDKDFEDLQETILLRAALINSHMFLEFKNMPEIEKKAEIQRLTNKLEEMSH